MTQVIEAARQGFVGSVTWAETWPGLLGAGRPARRPRRPGAARDAPHRRVSRRAQAVTEIAERVLRGNWLEGERDGVALRLHAAQPEPLPVAVVLGLLLRGDRLAPLRPGRARGPSWRACSPPSATDGFIGHTIFWDRPVSLSRLPFYNVASRSAFQTETIQPPLLAWAWRIAVGDPREEPRIARPGRLAGRATATSRATACSGSSSPTSRASTPRRSSTRSGAGGPARGSASRCSSTATAGSASTPAGSATRGGPVLCEVLVNTIWSLSLQALGRPSATPGAGRAALGRAPRALPRRGPARRRAARRSSPGRRSRRSPCPTCRRRSAGAWSRSTCSTEREFLDPGRAALGRRLASRATSPAAAAARSAATGAARPGSTRPGWSGSGCAGSATRRRRARLADGPDRRGRARRPARVLRPAHGHRPRRRGLRLVGPDRRAGRPGAERRRAICSGR